MALRNIASKWRYGAALAAALSAGGAIAICEEAKGTTSFDPEALERGAKALREINNSPHAKKVLDLAKTQEQTKQQELKAQEAQARAQLQQYQVEQERVRWQEQRQSQKENAQTQAEMKRYEDDLARKRMQAEHDLQRQRNAELVNMQVESSRRAEEEKAAIQRQVEAERRATEKYRADLEKEVKRAAALAEAEGRTKENRENEDVNTRRLLVQLEEERKKWLDAINAVFGHLGKGAKEVLLDPAKLGMLASGATLLFLGYFGAREAITQAGKAADRWFGVPRLVRETSRSAFLGRGKNKNVASESLEAVSRNFSDIVLPAQLGNNVRQLAAVTSRTRAHGAPFRHMLFYGPPGTGKTMAAKRLARTSGLDYAIMSGGDVAPLGGNAVTQIHELFDWAERSRKGLVLFIDEADAFLSKRGEAGMSEGLRGALNALLFRTGDQSKDFAVVLATNRPGDLDAAVLDRMDESLFFELPSEAERYKILEQYLRDYVELAGTGDGGAGAAASRSLRDRIRDLVRGRRTTSVIQMAELQDPDVKEQVLKKAARDTAGFSGRELAKLMASVQAAAFGAEEPVLTRQMLEGTIARKVHEHAQRQEFLSGANTFTPPPPQSSQSQGKAGPKRA